jgi:hypothetical protein
MVRHDAKEAITTVNDAVPTTKGTRVSALINNNGTVLVPGLVLGLNRDTGHRRLQGWYA